MPEPSVDGMVRTLDNNLSAKNVENSSQVSSEPSMTKNSFTSANGAVDYADDVEVVAQDLPDARPLKTDTLHVVVTDLDLLLNVLIEDI